MAQIGRERAFVFYHVHYSRGRERSFRPPNWKWTRRARSPVIVTGSGRIELGREVGSLSWK